MIRLLKLTVFIAHLPLSIFFYFRGKRYKSAALPGMQILLGFVICTVVATSQFFNPPQAEGSLAENIVGDPVAMSLANTVTASPPGIMSIHYNPAGLSLLPDGNFFSLGLGGVVQKVTQKFTADPNFKGFHDLYGNRIEDPVAGTGGSPEPMGYSPITDEASQGSPVTLAPLGLGFSQRNTGSKWTFGFANIYAPFASGSIRTDPNDPVRFGAKESYMQDLVYAAPAVSYQANKTLSIGISFPLHDFAFGTTMDLRSPNAFVNITKILGDATQGMSNMFFDMVMPMPLFGGGMGPYEQAGSVTINMVDNFTPSYNLGLLWEPLDWFSFGASYNSSVKTNLVGSYKFKYSEQFQRMSEYSGKTAFGTVIAMALDMPYQRLAEQSGKVTTNMEIPQMASAGIKLKPSKRLSLLADLHWANWSLWQQQRLVFDQKIQPLQSAKFMGSNSGPYQIVQNLYLKDSLDWSVGMEYQMLDWLMLRAGYENRKSSVPDEYFGVGTALADLNYLGTGLGIKLKNDIDIDLAFAYVFSPTYTSPSNSSKSMNSTSLVDATSSSYPGLNYEQNFAIFLGSVKITTPLSNVTRLLPNTINLAKKWWRPARKDNSLVTAQTVTLPATPSTVVQDKVDSAPTIFHNLQIHGQPYYTEDNE